MRSSSKIAFDGNVKDEPRLREIWGGVFYHPVFVAGAAEALGLKDRSRYMVRDGKQIGIANLLTRNRLGIISATLPLLFQYYGPLYFGCDSFEMELPEQDRAISSVCDFAHFSFPPDMEMARLPSQKSWRLISKSTPIVDSEGLRRWGNEFRDDVKNKVRKAARANVLISKSDRLPSALWASAYERKGLKPPIAPSALERWCAALIEQQLLGIYIARIEGTSVAFRGQLIYGDFAYDWLAGSDPEYHASGANQLLMSEVGKELATLGLKAWDLVGAEIKPIANFKLSFGAREMKYYQAWRGFGIKGKLYQMMRDMRHGK